MRQSRVRNKLRQDLPVLVTTLHLADPSVFELASLMGFDGIWLDMEHHAHSMETAQRLMRAARVGSSDIVARPAKGEFMRLGRMLEAGAQGIMYPRCDNAAEAAEVVKWSKFPPLGKRGLDGGNPDMPYGTMPVAQYLQQANEQTFLIVQIEEEAALDHVEEIAAVEGVDVIMLGPGDFSSLGGFPGQMDHPRLIRAIERIASAARRAGKHWGLPVPSVEEAVRFVNMGARFMPHGADLSHVKFGLERIQRDFAQAGFSFVNQLSVANNSAAVRPLAGPHQVGGSGTGGSGFGAVAKLPAATS
jgi:4-hydroxy-2-oxoheptanedioate aldolase